MEKQALLGSNPAPAVVGATYTNYYAGPRQATDKIFGGIFALTIAVFVAWSGARIAQNDDDNSVWLWNFQSDEWAPNSNVDGSACKMVSNGTPAPTPQGGNSSAFGGACENAVVEMIMTPLLLGLGLGVGGGAVIIIGFKYRPRELSYFAVILQVILPSVLAVYLMTQDGPDAQTSAGTDNDDGDGGADGQQQFFQYPAYALFGLSAVLAVVYYMARQSIELVAQLLKHSSAALRDNMCLIPLKAVFCAVFSLLYLGLLALCVVSFMSVEVVYNATDMPSCVLLSQSTWASQAYSGFFVLVIGWFAFYSLETRNYIVGDITAHWYYHGKGGGDISRATKHAFCSHFGSLAFAGLSTWFVDQLRKHARTTPGNPIGCVCALLARCILSYVEYLFKMATLMVAITGQSFGNSGIEVGRLFWASFGNMYHSTGVWYLPDRILSALSFFIAALLGIGYGVGSYYWTHKDCMDGTLGCITRHFDDYDGDFEMICHDLSMAFAVGSGVLLFFMVLFPLHFLCKMLIVIADTSFLCFLMDKRDNVVTKPEFHAVFGDVIAHKNCTDTRGLARASKESKKPPSYLREVPPGYSAAAPASQPDGLPQYANNVRPPTYGSPSVVACVQVAL